MTDFNGNHGDLEGRSETVLAVTVVSFTLASLFVFFRMVSRAVIVRKLGWDDYMMMLAWVIAFGLSFTTSYACFWGLGRREGDIPPSWQPVLGKTDYVFDVLYQPALMAIKSSILIFYLNLPTANKTFKWFCIGTLFVVNAGGLALTFVTVFQCRPIHAAFKHQTPITARCTDIVTIYLSSVPLNISTDLAIFFLPMPLLTRMHIPRKTKIILVITFGFGIFVAAVDIVRTAYLQSAAETRLREFYEHGHTYGETANEEESNFSWYGSFIFMWSAIEVNVGIMCACVPGLKPLISRFIPYMLRDPGETSEASAKASTEGTLNDARDSHENAASNIRDSVERHDFSPQESSQGRSMDIMEFLGTSGSSTLPSGRPKRPPLPRSSHSLFPTTQTFVNFIETEGKKSMVTMTVRESVFSVVVVTLVFFIWGFEYGLLEVLNKQFQRVSHMGPGQATGIHSAYFAGYFAGPLLVGHPVLKYWGFKACYPVGLSIYACGTLIFWPAAVLTSFPAFLITNFLVAFGLSILEVSANPFIFLCGPQKYGEIRLNLSQGVQAIGSVIAPLIANRAFFKKTLDAPSLVSTQWAYLGISLFTFFLAIVYFYLPLPEATDEELEEACRRADGANEATVWGVSIIWITFAFGVWSQFCYVGAQEVNATTFSNYLLTVAPGYKISNYLAIVHTAFAVSRFAAAGLGFWIKPRYQLLFFYVGAIVFEVLAMEIATPAASIASITMAFFMEGPLFSLIFSQTLRGMGRYTKLGGVLLTAAVSGGAVFSPISSHLVSSDKHSQLYLVVAVATFAAGTIFPIYLNVVPKAWKQVDPVTLPKQPRNSRSASASSATSRALSFLGIKKTRSGGSLEAEWKERNHSDS